LKKRKREKRFAVFIYENLLFDFISTIRRYIEQAEYETSGDIVR